MREINAFEAEDKLSLLLDYAEHGEEVLITRHGKPVARLVPHQPGNDADQARAAAQRIRTRAASLKSGAFDWQEWKSARDDNRP